MKVDLIDRVALVTGPASILADILVDRLAASGAKVEPRRELHSESVAVTDEHHQKLNVLINIALPPGPVVVADIEAICRSAADAMDSGGRILNLVSAFGIVPARGEIAASAASAAILALTRGLALEYGPRGILINALAIGAAGEDDPIAPRLLSHVPLGRSGTLLEIADAALFLVDPDNSYTTGHVLVVDGGWTAGYARDF